jgi:hypothetical protein
MSKEFALDLPESSGKSDAKLPLVRYDVVMIRRSPHGECEAINRCVQVPIEAAVFGVYSCWKIWMLKKKISIAIGTAFSRQRKNIDDKSQFLVRMRILQLVEIGVLRSSHAGYPGTPCLWNSVRSAFPTTYFGGIPELISLKPVKPKPLSRLLFSYPKHFRELLCRFTPIAQG